MSRYCGNLKTPDPGKILAFRELFHRAHDQKSVHIDPTTGAVTLHGTFNAVELTEIIDKISEI